MRWLNCVTEKSAASEACFPSLPTIPTPERTGIRQWLSDRMEMGQHTNVSGLDHAYVVPTITNAAYALLSITPDEPGDICLLGRRASTRDDCGKFGCNLYELIFEEGEAELRKT